MKRIFFAMFVVAAVTAIALFLLFGNHMPDGKVPLLGVEISRWWDCFFISLNSGILLLAIKLLAWVVEKEDEPALWLFILPIGGEQVALIGCTLAGGYSFIFAVATWVGLAIVGVFLAALVNLVGYIIKK